MRYIFYLTRLDEGYLYRRRVMLRTAKLLLEVSIAICLIRAPGSAQTQTAQVTGTVTDQTGAVIPAASIAVTQAETGLKRQSESNALGIYTVPLLPPGNYRITVQK